MLEATTSLERVLTQEELEVKAERLRQLLKTKLRANEAFLSQLATNYFDKDEPARQGPIDFESNGVIYRVIYSQMITSNRLYLYGYRNSTDPYPTEKVEIETKNEKFRADSRVSIFAMTERSSSNRRQHHRDTASAIKLAESIISNV